MKTSGWMRAAAFTTLLSCLCVFAFCLCRAQEASESNRKIVNRVAPQYPPLARNMKIQGSVKVEATVAPDGSVKTVQIRGGHPVLAEAAHDAIRNWKWEPAPKETREFIEVKFNP
jgi:TonB family protein